MLADRWMTTRDVAIMMDVSSTAVVRLIQRGTLASRWHGRSYMIRRSAVVALLASEPFQRRSRSGR